MKARIYCTSNHRGTHLFFLDLGKEQFFLFSQAYRKGVEEFYGRGVFIDESMNYNKAHKDSSILKTMEKIPMYVKYVEKEYDLEVLKQTQKRCSRRKVNYG